MLPDWVSASESVLLAESSSAQPWSNAGRATARTKTYLGAQYHGGEVIRAVVTKELAFLWGGPGRGDKKDPDAAAVG